MKRTIDFLKGGLGLLAILVMAAGLAVLFGSLGEDQRSDEELSPIPTTVAAATVDVSLKIEPELLALAELEEQQLGQGRQQAAEDIFFDEQDRIRVIIELDTDVITVQPSWTVGKPIGEQEAAQLIIAYGAEIISENELSNHITAYVPLPQIKALARDNAITHIWIDRIMLQKIPYVTPDPPAQLESLSQYDPNEHIGADQLWNRNYTGQGLKIAFVDTGFDTNHPAFSNVTAAAVDVQDSERDGGVTVTLDPFDPIGWPPIMSGNLNDPNDYEGHGTMMASLIAADGDSRMGVAHDSELLGIKIRFLFNTLGETQFTSDTYNLQLPSMYFPNRLYIDDGYPSGTDSDYDDEGALDIILTWDDDPVLPNNTEPDLYLTLHAPNGDVISANDANHNHNQGQVFEAILQEPFRDRRGYWHLEISRDNEWSFESISFDIVVRACSWVNFMSSIEDALLYATTQQADVVNISWSLENHPGVFSRITDAVRNQGIVVVSSAGNSGPISQTITSGNRHEITAGAVNANDVLQNWSSRGPTDFDDPALGDHNGNTKPDVVAPGADISAAVSGDSFGSQQGGYRNIAGTSPASAITAGAAALLQQYLDAHYTFAVHHKPAIVKTLLMNTGVNIAPDPPGDVRLAKDNDAGTGRIDLYRAFLGFPLTGVSADPNDSIVINVLPPAILPDTPSLPAKGSAYWEGGHYSFWVDTYADEWYTLDTAQGAYVAPAPGQPQPFYLRRLNLDLRNSDVEWFFASSYPPDTYWEREVTVPPGLHTFEQKVSVSGGEAVRVVAYWDNAAHDIDLALYRPDGTPVDNSTLVDVAVEQVLSSPYPTQGQWTIWLSNYSGAPQQVSLMSNYWLVRPMPYAAYLPLVLRDYGGTLLASTEPTSAPVAYPPPSSPWQPPVSDAYPPPYETNTPWPTLTPTPRPTFPPTPTPWPTRTPTRTPLPPTPTPPAPCGIAVFDDPVATYLGGAWTVIDDPGQSLGDRYHLSPASSPNPPPRARWSFSASYVSIGFKMGPSFGEFVVKIDGQVVKTLDAYAPEPTAGQWRTPFLGYGDQPHVLRLETLTGPPLTRLGVDYFILGYTLPANCAAPTPTLPPTLTPTPTPSPSPAPPCSGEWELMVDDDDPAIAYEGNWIEVEYPPALGGSYHAGEEAEYLFYSFSFKTEAPNQVVAWVGKGWGPSGSDEVKITLDGEQAEPNTHPWQPFPYMNITVTEPGEHLLEFSARGEPYLQEKYAVDAFLFCPDIRNP